MTCSLYPPGDTCLLTGTFDALTQAAGWALRAGIAGGRCSKWELTECVGVGGTLTRAPPLLVEAARPHLCHPNPGFCLRPPAHSRASLCNAVLSPAWRSPRRPPRCHLDITSSPRLPRAASQW